MILAAVRSTPPTLSRCVPGAAKSFKTYKSVMPIRYTADIAQIKKREVTQYCRINDISPDRAYSKSSRGYEA